MQTTLRPRKASKMSGKPIQKMIFLTIKIIVMQRWDLRALLKMQNSNLL